MNRREFGTSIVAAGATLAASHASAGPSTQKMRSNFSFPIHETPVVLEVAINGSTTKAVNPTAPETTQELADEAIRCLDAGASIIHAHSNKPGTDMDAVVQAYVEIFEPARKKHPHSILYPTANFDAAVYNKNRTSWPAEIQSGHYWPLAEAGLANMVLLDTGVVPQASYDENGLPGPADKFWWYGFWPQDNETVLKVCRDFGSGASISVFEPGWMKNVVAMARAGTLPRGSKLNIYFAGYGVPGLAPAIPEALQLYLHMIEGLDLNWSVGLIGGSVLESPIAQMALERGGSFRVGLEDWGTGPSNVEQMDAAKELIAKVGRPILSGANAIEYLDVPFPSTRP